MTDYFALLDEPRRPWVDTELLKQKFFERSASLHPDRVHQLGAAERAAAQQQYVDLNSAYTCLRDPRERIRHLLRLELGSVPSDIKQIPAELMDQFLEVGQLCKSADALVAGKERTSSPLLKVQLFQQSQDQTERLLHLQHRLNTLRDSNLDQLRLIDSDWDNSAANPSVRERHLAELQSLLHLLGFYDRWLAQIQERVARLSF